MTPTDYAQKMHAKISVFRDQREAVAKYARNMRTGHVLSMPPLTRAADGCDGECVALASSPAQLSDKLLELMFGERGVAPATRQRAMQSQRAGVVVSEVEWDEWASALANYEK